MRVAISWNHWLIVFAYISSNLEDIFRTIWKDCQTSVRGAGGFERWVDGQAVWCGGSTIGYVGRGGRGLVQG